PLLSCGPGELYLSVGVSYCQLRCFQEAVPCFQRALDLTSQWPLLLAKVLHNLGAALNSLGRFSPAVGYHRHAARLYGSLGCRGDQSRCFSNLAFACNELGDEEEAVENFIIALQGFKDTGTCVTCLSSPVCVYHLSVCVCHPSVFTCVSTEDHLAQVQVCESLAECYLRQKKQHKAVQLYKQALSTLSHCQDAEGVQDQLVERLTSALQQNLTVVQRPRPPRLHLPQPHPHSSPGVHHVRKSDTQSLATAANQQSDKQRGKVPVGFTGEGLSDKQKPSEQSQSGGGGVTETPDYTSITPGICR
uniref:Tetratricopeptide repeat domain 24 n=1 Tax=Kryptolebias marmoratus TaxID=37003 RepID=A0A3Q3GUC3_KRYMA